VHEVIMPKLGLTMEEGTIVRWLKSEGETVTEGDVLFEVQTDKVVMEVESPVSGILGRILVHEEETVPIAQVVAYIVSPGEEVPASVAGGTPAEVAVSAPRRAESVPRKAGAILATPAAKRLARDQGIDLAEVTGTGKKGMVVKEDVLAAMERGADAAGLRAEG
jgi:pyruvate dehydrogenase E2 component (dihydrolipoamide acetyltransferase)